MAKDLSLALGIAAASGVPAAHHRARAKPLEGVHRRRVSPDLDFIVLFQQLRREAGLDVSGRLTG